MATARTEDGPVTDGATADAAEPGIRAAGEAQPGAAGDAQPGAAGDAQPGAAAEAAPAAAGGDGGGPGPTNPRKPGADQTTRLADLLGVVEDAERVVIVTHDNPDPDAIASAAGLALLLEKAGSLSCTLAFGGIIGRAENRALIEELGVSFERVTSLDVKKDTLVALVDAQPRAGNSSLPDGSIISVVIDHHPRRPETDAATFADVRPEYGACCSMIVEYLRAARIEPDRRLATAMFYGIQSETMDLGREVSEADVGASLYLYPRSDRSLISRIRHARVPTAFFESIHKALERAWWTDGVICVPMGRLDYPDMVAQLADLFLRVEGVEWVIASGRYHDDLLVSLRAYGPESHAGELVREMIGDRGSAGGHGTMAGARLPVRNLSEEEIDRLVADLFADFCARVGAEGERRPVVPAEEVAEEVLERGIPGLTPPAQE